MDYDNTPTTNTLYKSIISNDSCDELVKYFNSVKDNVVSLSGSNVFPQRKQIRDIPDELICQIVKEITQTCSNYWVKFVPNIKNIRLYYSDFGIVKPHKDVSTYGDTHTLLIYLTENFTGGNLTVKVPRTVDTQHYYLTPEPRKCYGFLFPKTCIHYTDELFQGDKLILLVDVYCE
jgi:hypothetical protein